MKEILEQLSLFEIPKDFPCMSLEEMRSHEWVVCWSGGKDSTATIIKMRELGIPIKFIVFVLMMWDSETPAILPIMYDFVLRAKERFEEWGYKVLMPKSRVTAKEKALQVFKHSSYESLVGTLYGCRAFLGGGCTFQKEKERALLPLNLQSEYQMIGYAADETERLHRLTKKKQSILYEQGIEEKECFGICRAYNLLSPLYDLGFERDGCWFCPNCKKDQRDYLRANHPELYKHIEWMLSFTNMDDVSAGTRNNWILEYMTEHPKDQISMF